MPIPDDFVDDEVFGPMILRGRAEGLAVGESKAARRAKWISSWA